MPDWFAAFEANLVEAIGAPSYELWFDRVQFRWSNDTLQLVVGDGFLAEFIRAKYRRAIGASGDECRDDFRWEAVVDESLADPGVCAGANAGGALLTNLHSESALLADSELTNQHVAQAAGSSESKSDSPPADQPTNGEQLVAESQSIYAAIDDHSLSRWIAIALAIAADQGQAREVDALVAKAHTDGVCSWPSKRFARHGLTWRSVVWVKQTLRRDYGLKWRRHWDRSRDQDQEARRPR
ncbi:MAG: hypothetical protein MI757_12610 [Pirellulales bacterium]|nr:hypothetical protein [Pirellulales bacterium]